MEFLENKKFNIILEIIELLLTIVILLLVIIKPLNNKEEIEVNSENIIAENNESEEDPVTEAPQEIVPLLYKVDIKGAVNNPGVYTVDSNSIINDIINLAGGLKNNASTKYLNLSKKVTNEMVINIYTNYEISQMNTPPKSECQTSKETLNECKNSSIITPSKENTKKDEPEISSKKISINNGTKEELMTLSGIGESKANAIIEYRTTNGPFKKLEDITNVSGIGKEAFEKIKDNIEL